MRPVLLSAYWELADLPGGFYHIWDTYKHSAFLFLEWVFFQGVLFKYISPAKAREKKDTKGQIGETKKNVHLDYN